MKLRIRGNSIRLRLTQSEVSQLAAEGHVENAISFGNSQLRYIITTVGDEEKLKADFRNNEIAVYVPASDVRKWEASEQVGIEANQALGDGDLDILIEKDFACLKPREGEDDADTYAHPHAAGNG